MFAASAPSDAAGSLIEALNAVTVCVTEERLYARPQRFEPGLVFGVAFGRGALPVRLRAKAGGQSGLELDVLHSFVIQADQAAQAPRWRATTVAYEYRILDSRETELLVHHWQPGAIARGPDFPHVHVSAALSAQVSATATRRLALDKRHIPTGLVSLADVVRMLIAEFGIAYRHRNWAARLTRAEAAFRGNLTEML